MRLREDTILSGFFLISALCLLNALYIDLQFPIHVVNLLIDVIKEPVTVLLARFEKHALQAAHPVLQVELAMFN